MTRSRSPVSPIELQPLPATHASVTSGLTPDVASNSAPTNLRKESWLPFSLRWYYLVITTIISLCLGCILLYLTIYSKRNHGIGADNGSSAILFGWRFTPTLIAVLYAQMTVILFEDTKRTEPFARLAKAPAGGANAYGTLLQTPRAWWSIFIDVCFRRKRLGHTSWSLVCAVVINVIALLAISPLSSALLTSEEVLLPRSIEFTRVVPKANTQIPMVPTRETYYRAMNALLRNVSTSAWLNDTSMAFPFWPSSESAQFGPSLSSSYGAWKAETNALDFAYECQNMTLESANIESKQYSGVYTTQGYGPFNGTQPMVTFVLTSGDGCRYELTTHPGVDLAVAGGVTWSNASTYYLTTPSTLPLGGRMYVGGVSPNSLFARINSSDQCKGRDIITMNTPWTAPLNRLKEDGPFLPTNQTYTRSSTFRMRGILCDSRYSMGKQSINMGMSESSQQVLNLSSDAQAAYQKIQDNVINISQFQSNSMQDDWKTYVDVQSTIVNSLDSTSGFYPVYSGMAPLLAAPSNYNVSFMLDDPNIIRRASSMKGRFFMETLREAFGNRDLVETQTTNGEAIIIENRVVVLTEIGYTLAALFFAISILLVVIFWTSRLFHRPLNLRSDPASIIGLGLLLKRHLGSLSAIKRMHQTSRDDFYTALQENKYLTTNNTLIEGDENTDASIKVDAKPNWRPRVIHVRMLLALCFTLTLVLIAVLVLNVLSARSQLSQVAFIYEADVSKFGFSFSTFAPISIAPTVVSIVVGLWWDQVDVTWRILQPFISMSQGPVSVSAGAGLTYRSKSWVGAAFKSGRQKHWVLFMIAIGSVLAQVLTVSMSALFEKQMHNISQEVSLDRSLEMRQVPMISEVDYKNALTKNPAILMLDKLYADPSKNWLYGAGIQQSFNGSQLPWTLDGWNFLPVDLSKILGHSTKRTPTTGSADNTAVFSANVSMRIPAIKARLDCTAVDEVANVSSWIDFEDIYNQSTSFMPDSFAQVNGSGKVELYSLPDYIFAGSDSHTSTLSTFKSVGCCQNGTIADPQQSILGYWSPVLPPNHKIKDGSYPYDTLSWPLSLVSKWIVGKPIILKNIRKQNMVYFKETPRMQAAHCKPIIETAEASVVVDRSSGQVHTYQFDATTSTTNAAWSDVFTRHDDPSMHHNRNSSVPSQNVTASFGVLFLDALLGLADRSHTSTVSYTESLDENAFVFRDPGNGINMDLMTYSMYTLAKKDPEALLNFTTLAHHADRTFQTLFQHFVNSGMSLSKGGYAYQPIDDNSMNTLGHAVDKNGTRIAEKSFPVLNTNRTIEASVSQRIRVLHMNTTATYLSTVILIWLIFTTLLVTGLQRRYTRFINRDVQLIADMLVLIAGSDNLLELMADEGVELKKSKDVKTMLGWFRDRSGEVRWGVEVVGGRNAVEWVDAPKVGWHVQDKGGSGKGLFGWIK